MSDKTICYYDRNAEEFAAGTENADMQELRGRFLKYLNPGAKILDAGCGSGRDALAFLKAGYEVDAFDGSAQMCRIASERTGISVRQLRFEEVEGEDEYDGIWACASLLHVHAKDLPAVLKRLYKLLKRGGVLYVSFKYGSGEREKGDRYFHDLTESECRDLLAGAGFSEMEILVTGDVRAGRQDEKWVNAYAQKD